MQNEAMLWISVEPDGGQKKENHDGSFVNTFQFYQILARKSRGVFFPGVVHFFA